MTRGQNPLMLMMALSLPGVGHALGLGEIHVNSSLNEPLMAEIDIVGATASDLAGLTARVANRETFMRFGADRPSFLSTATFKVSHDAHGRPVLAIRSTEAFSEPLVDMVVDLRWHNGELVRQYSLLLDPAGFPSAARMAESVHTPALPQTMAALPRNELHVDDADDPSAGDAVVARPVSDASRSLRTMTHLKVGPKATLRGIAWRIGARSDLDIKKTMLALFRANPAAFDGNINRLHLGADLSIPSRETVAAINDLDAKREIHAQMLAWRSATAPATTRLASNHAGPAATAAPAAAAVPTVTVAPVETVALAAPVPAAAPAAAAVTAVPVASPSAASEAEKTALTQRIQMLEKGLTEMQSLLDREHDKMLGIQARVTHAEQSAPLTAAVAEPATGSTSRGTWVGVASGLALAAGAVGLFFGRSRRRDLPPKRTLSDAQLLANEPVETLVVERTPPVAATPRPKLEDPLHRDVMQEAQWHAQDEASPTEPAMPQLDDTALIDAWIVERAKAEQLDVDTARMRALEESYTGEDTVNLDATETAEALENSPTTMLVETMPTVAMKAPSAPPPAPDTKLDYNLTDLDLALDDTATHVHMPSMLNDTSETIERRTDLVTVLKSAVEREPERADLRMKLLETYYANAAANRQGFIEAIEKLGGDRSRMTDEEWSKISAMGRQIAADVTPPADDAAQQDDDFANCA
jgi:pilus assembly protein FimV